MADLLYHLIVYPIELVIELIFSLVYQMIGSLGYSILSVSIAVSLLVLPLYRRSDEIQEEERRRREKLAHWTAHIRRGFRGEERTMVLAEYYRQNGYRPRHALRGSVSLLLQIPFFLAAYHFLSELTILRGESFHFIRDLGQPDQILTIGGLAINVLPILMTGINIISGAVYTRGFPLSQKLQLYGVALVFLVALYRSPSGLVLYWTMNNIFSLGKNVFMKRVRRPEKALSGLCFAAAPLFLLAMWRRGKLVSGESAVFALLVAAALCAPLLRLLWRRRPLVGRIAAGRTEEPLRGATSIFLLSMSALALLIGALIPLTVIASSPEEFILEVIDEDPRSIVYRTAAASAGLFVLWCGVLFFFASRRKRGLWGVAAFSVLMGATADFLLVTEGTKDLSGTFFIGTLKPFSAGAIWGNLLVLGVVGGICFLLVQRRKGRWMRYVAAILLITVSAYSGWQLVSIRQDLAGMPAGELLQGTDDRPTFRFGRNGRNVLLVVVDRGIGSFVPYMLEEKPVLREQFAGFVYYPNTISFGGHTVYGMPSVFGGYDYAPVEINRRREEPLASKHDEALHVLPRVLSGAGFDVTVADPAYAGYREIPDLSIYRDLPEIRAYNLFGRFTERYRDYAASFRVQQIHNLMGYSFLRVAPSALRYWMHDDGHYWGVSRYAKGETGYPFRETYSVLEMLPEISELREDAGDYATILVNQTAHTTDELRLPDYVPGEQIDNGDQIGSLPVVTEGGLRTGEDRNVYTYEVNMAAFLKLGEWFSWLKEQGVYDNTRIVIAADHGWSQGRVFDWTVLENGLDVQGYNPVLMVKDYGAEGEPRISREFMTTGDVPALALEGAVEAPVNPYTGRPIRRGSGEEQYVLTAHQYSLKAQDNNILQTADGKWYAVTPGDILDEDNWRELPGDPSAAGD